jgi:hypothetical protein
MSPCLCSPGRMRRRILALSLPFCLALAGLLLALPARAHARAPERIPAPELEGATDYFGTDKPIHLKDLRGKIVILDFWTLC